VTPSGPTAARELGVEVRTISDHSSGRHTTRGAVLIHGAHDPAQLPGDPVIDYLDVASLILRLLGVEPPMRRRDPGVAV
jgi:hypothetical protein